MKCPLCDKGEIVACRDAIITYDIHNNKVHFDETVNLLDNSWIECISCGKSTDEKGSCPELENLEKQLDFSEE